MTWVRIHDHATRHPKILALSHAAFRLWVAILSYCQEHLTDGFVPHSALKSFGFRVSRVTVSELLRPAPPFKEPLLIEVEDGYEVHDFHDWNDSREEIKRSGLMDLPAFGSTVRTRFREDHGHALRL